MDDRSEATLATLHEEAQFRFRVLGNRINKQISPFIWKWIDGSRSYERQAQLYAAYKRGGPRAAPPGFSWHQFGFAADGGLFLEDSRHYVPESHFYDIATREGKRLGFHTGADFGAIPHYSFRPPTLEGLSEGAALKAMRSRRLEGVPFWP